MNNKKIKNKIIVFITALALVFISVPFLGISACNIYFETTTCGQETCTYTESYELCENCNELDCICVIRTPPYGRFMGINIAYDLGYITRNDIKNIVYHRRFGFGGRVYVIPDGTDCYEYLDFSQEHWSSRPNETLVRLNFTPTLPVLPELNATTVREIKYDLYHYDQEIYAGLIYLGTYNSNVAVEFIQYSIRIPRPVPVIIAGVLVYVERSRFTRIWVPYNK